MAGDTVITVVGNLTADPELRFTPSGAAVAIFTIASTPRTFDRSTNEWKDGEALFLRCTHLAAGGRERRRVAAPAASASSSPGGSSSGRTRPGGREAHRHRARGRRDRPVAALRHRQGQPHPARLGGGGGFGASGAGSGGGAAADDPWGSAAAAGRRRFSDEPPF